MPQLTQHGPFGAGRGGAINADLHAHSNRSDGVLTPAALVQRAALGGVELFALTDHDETSGLAEARAQAHASGLRLLDGVEISVTWGSHTVHIVGIGIDPANPALGAGLAAIRAGRDERAARIDAALAAAGFPDTLAGAAALAINPALLSRMHFARHLVDRGVATDVHAVFQRLLTPGKPGYVPHAWARLADAVQWIVAAGGAAIIAHPGRYRLDDLAMDALVGDFRTAGGVALEVASGTHGADQVLRFADLAQRFGLAGSRGSDFHAPGESRVELGQAPRVPDHVVPVWERFL
jgi:hypothetical protein